MSTEPQDRFPGMKPLTKAPSLGQELGIGLALLGRRDDDPETGTYVATHCFTFLFVPLVALGAYRVASANDRWYFLGKVPLSPLAFRWNVFFLVALLLGGAAGGWTIYQRQPGPKARRQIAQAEKFAADGEQAKAATLLQTILRTAPADEAEAARGKLRGLIESPPADGKQAAGVFRVAVEVHREGQLVLADLFDQGTRAAVAVGETDPAGALEVIEIVAPFAATPRDHLGPRRRWLEKLVERQPADVDAASRLGVVYDALGEREKCEKLLAKHEKSLGEREGAAILGRIYARQGQGERAFALLEPFVAARLPRLHAAEKDYHEAIKAAQQRVLEELRSGKAAGFDYESYKGAGKVAQDEMVGAYLDSRLKEDQGLKTSGKALREESAVVSAALDLGIVRLGRAQAQAEPARRRAELEAAEKAFLSVRNLAGQTTEYRLFLGQVYYWLGKHAEGRKLFDQLLDAEKRATPMLLGIARTLREVGAITEARKMAEEAHEKASDQRGKYDAALTRSVMAEDLAEKITWLERANPADGEVKASLAYTRGLRAAQEGKDDTAAGQYREAIATYAKMPENSSTLNNSALVHFALYRVTSEREQFTRGLDKLERALALEPGNSILLSNVAGMVLENTLIDVIGTQIDLTVTRQSAGLSLLHYLYRDEAGRKKLADALAKHPGTLKARALREKELLLAPKRSEAYDVLSRLLSFTDDDKGLQAIHDRLAGVELDLERNNQLTRDYYVGKDDPKRIEEMKKAVKQMEDRLPAARKKGGRTFAAAAGALITTRLGAWELLGDPGAEAQLRLAEEAHKAAPSEGTRNALAMALRFRAHQALIQAEPAYAALAKKHRRALGEGLIGWVLAGEKSDLRDKVADHADVKRVITIRLEQLKSLPARSGPSTWAILQATHPAEAEKLARLIQGDRRAELRRAIEVKLSPVGVWPTVEQAWALRAGGKADDAAALLKRAAKAGIPLPE